MRIKSNRRFLFNLNLKKKQFFFKFYFFKGFFCDIKRFIRKNNEQDFKKLNSLITESFEKYKEKKLGIKLWNRFWNAIEMYHNKSSYENVLCELFGAKSTQDVKSHRKIYNTLLLK